MKLLENLDQYFSMIVRHENMIVTLFLVSRGYLGATPLGQHANYWSFVQLSLQLRREDVRFTSSSLDCDSSDRL